MAKEAAGVLVQRAGRILSVRRKDGSIGLPCGKVERDESNDECAERECLEETGYTAALTGEAYEGKEGDYSVYIFPASILTMGRGSADPETLWLLPEELCVGRFAEFNKAVLDFFYVI